MPILKKKKCADGKHSRRLNKGALNLIDVINYQRVYMKEQRDAEDQDTSIRQQASDYNAYRIHFNV